MTLRYPKDEGDVLKNKKTIKEKREIKQKLPRHIICEAKWASQLRSDTRKKRLSRMIKKKKKAIRGLESNS